MIKISVIIPIYNAQEYLIECIQSVQKQTMAEIEIVCVDDGSTDNSWSLLIELQRADERIRVFRQTNQGAGAARNLALKYAEGEFICFLDSDDYLIEPSALEKLYHKVVEQQVKVCGGQFYVAKAGELKDADIYGRLNWQEKEGGLVEYIDYQYDYFYQGYIYLRKMIIDNYLLFPGYGRFEDPPFFVRAMWEAGSFCIVDIPFYCYRVEEKRLNYTDDMMMGLMQGMIDNLQFSGEKGLKRLHRISYYRILQSCGRELNKFVQEGNEKIFEKLKKANDLVRWEWLEEQSYVDERIMKPFSDMLEWGGAAKGDKDHTENWILPVRFLQSGERVALYGAGEVGKSFFRQIQKKEDYTLCVWADRNYNKIAGVEYEIISPAHLMEMEFDHIIIAIEDMDVALDIIDDLRGIGIPAHKIVWSNVG